MRTKVPQAAAHENTMTIEMKHHEQQRDTADDDLRSVAACGGLFLDRGDAAMLSVNMFHICTAMLSGPH